MELLIQHLGVSKNRGTPKSSILIGFSIINHPFWGMPIFGNIHFETMMTPSNINWKTNLLSLKKRFGTLRTSGKAMDGFVVATINLGSINTNYMIDLIYTSIAPPVFGISKKPPKETIIL